MIWLLFALFQGYMITRCPSGLAPESLLAAQGWTHGLLPYRDFQMHVGPLPAGIFYLLFSIPPLVWCSLVFSCFTLLTALGTYKLACNHVSRFWAALAAGMFLLGNVFLDGNAMEVQTIVTTFGVWAFYFCEEDRPVWMAAMLFLAFATKQTALLYLLALIPFWDRRDYLRAGWVFCIAGVVLLAIAYHLNTLLPAVRQLTGWTLYHAILDPLPRWQLYRVLLLRFAPFALISLFVRWPLHFRLVAGLFLLGFAVVPESHFLLGILPFFCVMSAVAAYRSDGCLFAGICLILIAVVFGGGRFARQVGVTGRKYGMADFYYYSDIIQKAKPFRGPVWTNAGMIYFLNDLPVPDNDFLSYIQGDEDQRHKNLQYLQSNTRIFMERQALGKPPEGGIWKDYPLTRGQYAWMRIWRRKESDR